MFKIIPTTLYLVLIALLLTGCTKEDFLKEPSQVGIRFALNSAGVGGSDNLSLTQGYVVLSSVQITGQRTKGDGFSFSRSFPLGMRLDFNAPNRAEKLVFDLPQGDYKSLSVRFTTLEDAQQPSWMVLGKYAYRQPSQGSAWIDIAWHQSQTFERIVTNAQGTNNFVLGTNPEMVTFTIQPKLWFRDVTEVKLEQGLCTTQARGQVMLLDAVTNNNIFQVLDRVLGSTLKATL